ncbi:hypothetical protein LCGC14_1675140 [marine sediment metagenome]|uniref:Uncharacterized protein n=1 Tax=marine sediment metagenome TaxID=412755 RepID=A0A0F9K5Z2_9ZZZZ
MPLRIRGLPPGEFMRNHLVAAGGIDYPQSMYKAYKNHLKAEGLEDGCSRASWSRYIWMANRIGLIQFDHAEAPTYWNAQVNGVEVPPDYVRESRPQAPSPRHYYRILDPTDPRWIRLEVSYRETIGFEAPPAAPRPAPKPPKEKAPPKPKPEPKPPRKVRVVTPKPPTAEEKVRPYEERVGLIVATLSELESSPSLELVAEIENSTLELAEDVIEVATKARGTEKTLLSNLTSRLLETLDDMPLLRSSVQRYLASTAAERERNMTSLRAAIRVVNENLTPLPGK